MKNLKVACIGNMNNMLFSLTRYLRDRGIDAWLLMQHDELEHFLPQHDTFDSDILKYTKRLEWGGGDARLFSGISSSKILNDLKEYDFFIVTGSSAAYLYKAGIKIDIFFPHGSDIKHLPFKGEMMRFDQIIRNYSSYRLFTSQKRSIQKAAIVNIEHSDPYWDEPIKRLHIEERTTYFGCPMVYAKPYKKINLDKTYAESSMYERYKKIRETHSLVIVNHARQLWKSYMKISHPNKGSDQLIKGYARFLENNGCATNSSVLILFEYGDDINESKKLISELGIGRNIIWQPLTSRKEILVLLSLSDFSCGEFGPGDIGGGTTWEALATGTCLLHYVNSNFTTFDNFFSSQYPFVNVKEPDAIANVLQKFIFNEGYFKSIGAAGMKWYEENFEKRSMNRYTEIIGKKSKVASLLSGRISG